MSDLSRSLVDAAAEAIANRNKRAWTHSDDVQYRLEGQDAAAAVLETLGAALDESARHHDALGSISFAELRGLAAEVKTGEDR